MDMQDAPTLERKIITAQNKPDNVFVTETEKPENAYEECKIALLSGYNAAVWNYPALNTTNALRKHADDFSVFFEENRLGPLASISPTNIELPSNSAFQNFTNHFSKVLGNITKEKNITLPNETTSTLLREIEQKYTPLSKIFNESTLRINLDVDSENEFFKGTSQHFDGRQHFGEKIDGWCGNNLVYITILETMLGHSTIIFDNKDFESSPVKTRENGWHDWDYFTLKKPSPTLWMPDHFSVTLMACSPWPHMPCIHSFPVQRKSMEEALRLKIHSYLQFKPNAHDLKAVKAISPSI